MDRSTHSPAYDAFGDLAAGGRSPERGTRRARNLAVAVFWSIALLLIAGRVYQSDLNAAAKSHAMEIASR